MRKAIIVMLLVILSLSLTACENPNYSSQVTFNEPTSMGLMRYEDTIPFSIYGRFQPEGLYTNNVLTYNDKDIEFALLHIFKEDYTNSSRISSYGISIVSDVDLRIDIYSGYNIIFSIDFEPNGKFEYKQTIPNNLFVGIQENEEVTVKISPLGSQYLGDEFYSGTFTYIDNYEPSALDLQDYQAYQNLYYPVTYAILVGVVFSLSYLAIAFIYIKYYKKAINQLLEQDNKTKFLLSPYILSIGLLVIMAVSGIFVNELLKTRYHENHFSNLYVSATTTEVWDLDWDNITLNKLDVRVNGEEMATYMNVTDRIEITAFLEYGLIKDNVDNIIQYKKDEPVCWGEDYLCTAYGFWSEIELYLTDGSTTFMFSIREYDDFTYYCAFSRASGPGLLYFTIDEEDPYFSDVKSIHDIIEEALADYMTSMD